LYDGIGGELLKAFFNHGLTMLAKDIVHRFLVRMYLATIGAIRQNPKAWLTLVRIIREIRIRLSRIGVARIRR